MRTRVGLISTTFRGSVELSDLDPPHGYTLTGSGQGGAAGFARMVSRVSLQAEGDEETLRRYTVAAEIGSKPASVGSRLVQSVARKNAEDFFAALARRMGTPATDAAARERPGSEPFHPPATGGPMPAMVDALPHAPRSGGIGALVPAWLLLFCTALGTALGYCLGLLRA